MKGIESLSGLPYCVGVVDGCNIPLMSCPDSQYYDYRCYKGFPSLVLFAVTYENGRFLYCDYGLPGVMGDSNIFEISELKRQIDLGLWLGSEILR